MPLQETIEKLTDVCAELLAICLEQAAIIGQHVEADKYEKALAMLESEVKSVQGKCRRRDILQ